MGAGARVVVSKTMLPDSFCWGALWGGEAEAVGTATLLRKPFKATDLAVAVRSALDA